jgi:hypothetical protein
MTPRSLVRASIIGALLVLSGAAQAAAQDRTTQRSFKSGGTIHLDLSAGEYRITASPDDTIRITPHATSKHPASAASVRIDTNGSRADLTVDGPFNDGVKVDIELPRQSHVVMDLSAGELSMKGIEGSKDISANAGELNIEVGDRERYRHVNASVRIGELRAPRFNVAKEGFFRSFAWDGRGGYDLRVKLMVGELTLN